MRVTFFKSSSAFREWLEDHHDTSLELWVGFYKKDSGKAGITYPGALDEALCFGWIDGIRRNVDALRYTIRFSPRRPRSIWSLVNTRRAEELNRLGRMTPAGRKAFAARDPKRSALYSFENAPRKLDAVCERKFRANRAAWEFFQAQPPGYQRVASFWVMSAKQEETRLRRLTRLMNDSEQGLRLAMLGGAAKRKPREDTSPSSTAPSMLCPSVTWAGPVGRTRRQ
jgi:uncharacterized protein YdeI (YjbR/CyaY-like superfamily)